VTGVQTCALPICRAGEWLADAYADRPVWLWVIEANTNARRFYDGIGATNSETVEMEFSGGGYGRSCRYTWASPQLLMDFVRR